MKNTLKLTALSSALLLASTAASADVIGFTAAAKAYSAEVTNNDDDQSSDAEVVTELSAALEHPVPIIPNIRIAAMDASYDDDDLGGEFDQSFVDATLYYEILDTVVEVDLGLTARMMDLSAGNDAYEYDSVEPMAYAKVQGNLPLTGLSLGAIANMGADVSDFEAFVQYELAFGLGFNAGYRMIGQDLEYEAGSNLFVDADFDTDFEGAFLGIYFDI